MSDPTTREALTEALAELDAWLSGDKSHWNDCHGAVTGDYERQFTLTIEADNAQKIALAAKVNALTALLAFPAPTEEPTDAEL